MKQEPPAKDWVFTIWPQPGCDFEDIVLAIKSWPYKYIIFQIEVGADHNPHVQGFIQFPDKLRLTALKKLYPTYTQWAKRRGTPYEAQHYCMKPVPGCDCEHCKGLVKFDDHYEDGWMTAEQQYKVHEIAKSIKRTGLSRTIDRFPEAYLHLSYGMERLANFYSPRRDYITRVTVVYGQPDAGKTRYAMLAPAPYKLASFSEKGSADFFGDYRPDRDLSLVVDDFYSNWKYTTFLQACDRYPMEVHTKGGFRQLLVRDIIFTSNLPPHKWYPNVLSDMYRAESFHRRIHNIIFFHKIGYQLIKGDLPWPLPFLRRLTPDDYLMNPQILDFQNQGNRPQAPQAVRNWRQGSRQRSASSHSVDLPQAMPQNVYDPLFELSLRPPFGPETYEQFVARRTPNFG